MNLPEPEEYFERPLLPILFCYERCYEAPPERPCKCICRGRYHGKRPPAYHLRIVTG